MNAFITTQPWHWPHWWLTLVSGKLLIALMLQQGTLDLISPALVVLCLGRALHDRQPWAINPLLLSVVAALCVLPSTRLTLLASLLLCAGAWQHSNPQQRRYLWLHIAVLLHVFWQSVGFAVLSGVLLPLDAAAVSLLAEALGHSSHYRDNLVTVAGQSLLILQGCASLPMLSWLLMAWAFAGLWLNLPWAQISTWQRLITVCLLAWATNLLRLLLMSLDTQWYQWLHSGPIAGLLHGALLALLGGLLLRRAPHASA